MRIVPYELWGSSKCGGLHSRDQFEDSSGELDLNRNFRRSWAKIFRPRLFRKCECTACSEPDKKVEEFFTKKRYWWSSRTLWKISWNQFHEIFSVKMMVFKNVHLFCFVGRLHNLSLTAYLRNVCLLWVQFWSLSTDLFFSFLFILSHTMICPVFRKK